MYQPLTGGCALLITIITLEMSIRPAPTTITMQTTQMAWRSAPLLPDKVTCEGEIRASWREGEYDPPERVNRYSDRSRWTLLAWQGLMVIPCFIPGDLMQLYVIIRQLYGV